LEAGLFGGCDRNQVYDISNTKVKGLRITRSVSIIGCMQSVPSTLTLEFQAILNQQVEAHMIHLAAKTTEIW